MHRLALTAVLVAAATSLPLAHADNVDDFIKADMAARKIPGVAIAITRDGKVIRAQGYGLANIEHQVPVKPETVFQSGSVGKQFTSMAIMMLAEAGKLSIDDPVSKYFGATPLSWKPIKLRHLLTHTSGIKDWGEPELDNRRDYTEDQLVAVAKKLPLDFVPGTQWSYSNTGYVLLGIVIHKVSGQFYGDFLQERVFKPLGMSRTRVISERDIIADRAAGYELVKDELKNQEWVSPMLNTTADGSLYTTVLDLAKWDAALRGEALVKKATLDTLWTPVTLKNGQTRQYGFGWGFDVQRGHRIIEHGGSWQGFRATVTRYVDDGLGILILANLAQAQPEAMSHAVAGLIEPALALPDPRKPGTDPDPKRSAALAELLANWTVFKPAPLMATALSTDNSQTPRSKAGRKYVGDVLAKKTAFDFLVSDDVAGKGFVRRSVPVASILHYGLQAGGKAYTMRFFLDGEGKVIEFDSEETD